MPRVRDLLTQARAGQTQVFASLINLGEVVYIVERERGLTNAHRVLAVMDQLPITFEPITRPTVLAAAHLKARFPLAYADAFAAVTAQNLRATLVTGDKEFMPLAEAGLVSVEWLQLR